MCISSKFRRSLQDVRVKRGADVASDHHLVLTRLKLNRNWNRETCHSQRCNTTLLKDIGKQEEYRLPSQTGSRFCKSLWERRPWMNKWKKVKDAVTTTCKEVIGHKKHSHNE
jgi:RNase P subunit RPR2